MGHLIGQTRTFEADGHRGKWKWALGANGHLGKMGTTKNERQGKQVGYLQQMSTLEYNGHLGTDGHWGEMGIWGKCTPGKMSTRANQQLGQMGTLEQKCILGLMDIGASGL